MMTIRYQDSPEQFVGQGTAFIAWDENRMVYDDYWDLLPDGDPTPLEPMPETSSTDAALAWGRARTQAVVIRPKSAPSQQYWGGTGDQPEHLKDLGDLPPDS